MDGGRTEAEQPTTSASYSSSQAVSFTQPPSLKDVMHVEKVFDKTAEEITEIWKQYHADKDKIFAVIPSNVYSKMYQLSQQCPLFVYPLPRSQGYEMMFSQFSGHRCYLTSLLLYKRHQENAPPCLTLSHYIDLMDSKGIVLMSGEVDTKMISVIDAQYLANQVQLYYITEENGRCSLLRAFNHSQEEFDYTKLFEHLQSGIESQQK
jgi:ATP synthase F1 complex assembly factor 1